MPLYQEPDQVVVRLDPVKSNPDGTVHVRAHLPNGAIVEGDVPNGSEEAIALAAARLPHQFTVHRGGDVAVSKADFERAVAASRNVQQALLDLPGHVERADAKALELHAINNAPAKGDESSKKAAKGDDAK